MDGFHVDAAAHLFEANHTKDEPPNGKTETVNVVALSCLYMFTLSIILNFVPKVSRMYTTKLTILVV